ncbi:MAG: phosphoribosyltransferase [Candidatus Baltobacteraceae bacterium]
MLLAQALTGFNGPSTIVLALPRGGVPVAYETAQSLNAPLDVFVVRKLGAPGQPELALGAVAGGGVRALNHSTIDALQIDDRTLARITDRENAELARQEQAFRGARPFPDLRGRQVLLVDDGMATGASMLAAIAALRAHAPRAIVAAVPVAAPDTFALVERHADAARALYQPRHLQSVGKWYRDFHQVSDDEVRKLLA